MLCTCKPCNMTDFFSKHAKCERVDNTCILCERPVLITKVGPAAFQGSWVVHGVKFQVQGTFIKVGNVPTWISLEDEERIVREWRMQTPTNFVDRCNSDTK